MEMAMASKNQHVPIAEPPIYMSVTEDEVNCCLPSLPLPLVFQPVTPHYNVSFNHGAAAPDPPPLPLPRPSVLIDVKRNPHVCLRCTNGQNGHREEKM